AAATGIGSPAQQSATGLRSFPAWWVNNIVEDWKLDGYRRFVGALAGERQVIRYDHLGCGMSDRELTRESLTLDHEVAVLAALIDHLGLERVSIVGGSFGGCTAVPYTVRHPECVDRLVLYGSFASGAKLARPDVRRAM